MWKTTARTLGLLAIVILAYPRGAGAQETFEGVWTAREGEETERPWVQLSWGPEWRQGGMSMDRADAQAMWDQARRNGGEVDFTIDAPAGRIVLQGAVSRSRGSGTFTFTPDVGFEASMERAGIAMGHTDEDEWLAAALHRVSPAAARELQDLGFRSLDFEDVLAAAIFDVTTNFVRAIRARDMDGDLDDFVAFSIHGVTPDYVDDARSWGPSRLDADDLLAFRIHGITDEFVREVTGWDLGPVEVDDVMAAKIHGVSGEYLRAMEELDAMPDDLDQAVAFRIHGVTPELIRELREEGFDDLTNRELIKVRIFGFDRLLRRRGGGGDTAP
jgi:hypothetical protein